MNKKQPQTDSQKETAVVLGGGSFGTAMASIIAVNGHEVRMWVRDPDSAATINQQHENPRYLPGEKLPDNLSATADLSEALAGATMVFVAIPSRAFEQVLSEAADYIAENTIVVSCTKGIHEDGFLLMSQLLHKYWPHTRIGVLSGPNLAKEIVEKKFTGTVIASPDAGLCNRVQRAMSCSYFRVYDNPDPFGVELGGALKNIYAVATGMAAALGVGDNTKGLLITRSLAEMGRFASLMGANPMTFLGLAGVGDLVVTCSSPLSRNYRVGYLVGQGRSLEDAVNELGQTAEGVNTIRLVAEKAEQLDIYMPIVTGLYGVLYKEFPISRVVESLMQGEHNHDVEFVTAASAFAQALEDSGQKPEQ